MPGARLAAVVFAAAVLPQTPVFRGGVDLVSVDVIVLDRAGAPVTGLTAADFVVEAGGVARRIVAADYITARRAARPLSPAAAAAPSPSSNTRQPAPRTLIFVVDVENILSGEGRLAMQGIADYLERLGPEDRVGLVALPSGDPRIEPTTVRTVIRGAVTTLAGTSMRLRDRQMTFGEAVGIAGGDRRALAAYWYRIVDQGRQPAMGKECGPPQGEFERPLSVPLVCIDAARRVLDMARYHTRRTVDVATSLATAMAPLPGPKGIVLVSGGVVTDPETLAQLREFATAAERARVSLYSLFIEAPQVEASAGTGNTTETKIFDNQIGLAGLSDLALSARGVAQRIHGDATPALERIDRELSGYYLISFERSPGDREHARVGISVRTRRSDVSVMARKEFTATAPAAPPPAAPPADLKAAIGQILQSSSGAAAVPLDVDVYSLPVTESGAEARAIVAIEVGRAPDAVAAFGFQVADASGKVLADGFEAPVKAQPKGDSRALLLPAVALASGTFTARFAVVDASGAQGSVQHTFAVPVWNAGPIRLSELFFGDATGAGFRPGAAIPDDAPAVAARLIVRDASGQFDGVRVRLLVARGDDDSAVENLDVPLLKTADPLRRFADAVVGLGRYPPGEYLVTAIVTARGAEIGRRSRLFRR
jgi:VWFA-related protein